MNNKKVQSRNLHSIYLKKPIVSMIDSNKKKHPCDYTKDAQRKEFLIY